MYKVESKKNNDIMVIRVTKVAMGHQPHFTGTGVHADKRTKRQRTRRAQLQAALKD